MELEDHNEETEDKAEESVKPAAKKGFIQGIGDEKGETENRGGSG